MRVILCCLSLLLFCSARLILAEVDPSWTTPIVPFRIADNLYYVGSQDLASYLVVTPKGNILINANYATSPAQIRASVEALGFRWNDTKILLNSQAHGDHMAGAAEVIRETRAKNMVMDGDVSVVETGARADFLSPSPNLPAYAPVRVDRILHDGDTVSLGGVTLTARKNRRPHARMHDMDDALSPSRRASGDDAKYRHCWRDGVLVGVPLRWYARPSRKLPRHRSGFPAYLFGVACFACDVFLGAHGGYFNMLTKLKRYPQEGPHVFIDPDGYRQFVADAQETFEKELSKQRAAAVH